MHKGKKGAGKGASGKAAGGKANVANNGYSNGYSNGYQSGHSESPGPKSQGSSAVVRSLDEDALRLSEPNLALPWAVLGLASPPKLYWEHNTRKATLRWLVHWVSCRSAVSDWASGERNSWQRSLGGRNDRYERFRTGVASMEVFACQGDWLPLDFLPVGPGLLKVAKPFCVCLAHRRPETEGSFTTLCPDALQAVRRMRGSTVSADSADEYADKWKGLIETEAVASSVDEGLGRHLADTYVEWEQGGGEGEIFGKFQVKAALLFAHKIKFRSAMLHGEWASSWLCIRRQDRGDWSGHGAVVRACFPTDDKDLLFAEEEEEWKDSTQNLQVTFRVLTGSSPHQPEDGYYTLELIQKALADSCMASALHELKVCPLVQSMVLTGKPEPEPLPMPAMDLSAWGLNDSQLSAVTFALQNPFALVQGPPGTGKTMTTAVLATCFARDNMASGANRAVLLCTPTNRAADCAAAFVARICRKQAEQRLHERSEVEGNVCAICLSAKPDMITLCGHAFHKQCLLQALDVGSCCPICRQQVKHVDTGLRILRIYGADIEKQEFPVPKRNEHSGIDYRKPVQVPEEMRRFALHWRCHAAVEGEQASAAAQRTRRAYSAMMKHGTSGPKFDQLRRTYQLALAEARAAELREADIVFTTCVSCRRMAVAQALSEEGAPVFWQVIVDEAGQATEPEALCPLTFAKSAKQICLFGDHQQLRPILKSQLTEGAGLAISLFERLVIQGRSLQFLALQYRMNPGISWFPSHQFYGGRLLDDRFVQRQPPGLLERPGQAGQPVSLLAWEVDSAGGAAAGERVSHTRTVDNSAGSRLHAGEAQRAARLAEALAKVAGPQAVGVLCWYRAQVAAIVEELRCPGIHVGSVATAQGSEWDYVLLSTVRRGGASAKGRLGIVADPHNLNVAITRARRGLIVLGHEGTLSQDANWKAFFDHCRGSDALIQGEPLITTQPAILEETFARALVPGVKVEIHGLQSSPELNGKTGTVMTLANERGRWEVEVKKGTDSRRLALKPSNLSLAQAPCETVESSPQSKAFGGLKALVKADRPDGVEFSKTWQVPAARLDVKTKLALGEEVRINGPVEGLCGALRSRGPDSTGCWTVEVCKCFCMQQGPVDVRPGKKGLEVTASGGVAHLLQPGTVVMLHGLKSQPKLNAEWGVVTSESANDDGRWEVEVMDFGPSAEVRRLLMKPDNLAPEV